MSPSCPLVSVVVPAYNESENLPELYQQLIGEFDKLDEIPVGIPSLGNEHEEAGHVASPEVGLPVPVAVVGPKVGFRRGEGLEGR